MNSVAGESLRSIVARVYRWNPSFVRRVIGAQKAALESLEPSRSQSVALPQRSIEPFIEAHPIELDLIDILIKSYSDGIDSQKLALPAYKPGADWKSLLDQEWRLPRQAIVEGDRESLREFLGNFFRNEGLSGFWGHTSMFSQFVNASPSAVTARAASMKAKYETWRELFPEVSIETLAAPPVGNPWGYLFDGSCIFEPAFEYHYQANWINSLVAHIEHPVVAEIGGGFGGLGYFLKLLGFPGTYIAFDLPENALLQAFYLACTFPAARVLTYSPDVDSGLTWDVIRDYDFVVLPNFCLPLLDSEAVDAVVNVRSLSEMPMETIVEYLAQIDRIGRLWFFHENIYKARRDTLWGVPSTSFPPLRNFSLVSSSPSRWPSYSSVSGYPCRENLFIRSEILN